MPTDVIMPQMGESIFEGTITKWLKKAGDPVEKDEPLFEISTDKVDAEIPSPVSGVLREINRIVADLGANISAQKLATDSDIGYLVLDTDRAFSMDVKHAIEGLSASIKTRILY